MSEHVVPDLLDAARRAALDAYRIHHREFVAVGLDPDGYRTAALAEAEAAVVSGGPFSEEAAVVRAGDLAQLPAFRELADLLDAQLGPR